MNISNLSRIGSALAVASLAVTGLTTNPASAALVAYFPITSTTDTGQFLNDTIDNPSHPITDATTALTGGSIVNDVTRGDVLFTTQGHRLTGGDQGADLAEGFTWSLWFKGDPQAAGTADAGADVIIGSRRGIWNKVQPTGTQRWFDLGNYNLLDNQWHHIAYTGDLLTGAAFYVDGLLVASDPTPFNGITATGVNDDFEIGGSVQFAEDVEGFIDDIAVWNERLSAARIAELAAGASVVQAIIPEPATAALGLIGAAGLMMRRRRIA